MKNLNIILIDLDGVGSVEEMQLILDSQKLNKIDPQKIIGFKPKVKSIFVDKVSQKILFCVQNGSNKISNTQDLHPILKSMENSNDVEIDLPVSKMTTDEILEKISRDGINSLSKEEKDRLDFLSKS